MSTIQLSIPGNFDSATPPGLSYFNSKPRVLFDDTTDEHMHWTFRMPSDYSSALTAKIQYSMASATTNNLILAVEVMAVSDGDAAAIDADSYDTVNTSAATAVPGTAGYMDEISITLTNADSVAAGDWVAIRLSRDANNAGDTTVGDAEIVAMSLEYTAA